MKKFLIIALIFLVIASCSQTSSPGGADMTETGEPIAKVTETPKPTTEPTAEPTPEPTVDPTSLYFRPTQQIVHDLFYIEDGNSLHRLDLYLPVAETSEQTFPIIVLFHAGGVGKWQMSGLALKLVEMGFSVVSVDFWHKPPTKYKDSACAVGWVYENAEDYGFDLEHIYLLGQSAGGAIAAFLGTVDDFEPYTASCPSSIPEEVSFKGVIIYTAVFDYTAIGEDENSRLFDYVVEHMGVDYATGSDFWWEMSPIAYVDGTESEFVLFHGERDRTITQSQSNNFAAALENVGVKVTLNIIDGADHYGLLGSVPAFRLLTEYLLESIQ